MVVQVKQEYPIEIHEGDTIQSILDKSNLNGGLQPDEIYLNGCAVEYKTPLCDGDELEIVYNDLEADQEDDTTDDSDDAAAINSEA